MVGQGQVNTELSLPLKMDTSGCVTKATTIVTQIPGLCRIFDQTVHNQLREAGIFLRRLV